jgi:putative membrane protein
MSLPGILFRWSIEPSVVVGVLLVIVLYCRGTARSLRAVGGISRHSRAPQALAFAAGLLVVIVALESPIDYLSGSLFSFHMIQHLLLIMVAAPLLLLGDPGVALMRGIPLDVRRSVLQAGYRRTWVRRFARVASKIGSPRATFIIFAADLYLWHWSRLFNLTLRNDTVHLTEHLCFLVTAMLWWSQVIDQRAMHARLSYIHRAVFTVLTAGVSNVLALYFVFAPRPLYSAYAGLRSRPYGMTVLGDQQIAGAIMWVPVLFVFGGAFAILLYKALGEDERESTTSPTGGIPYTAVFSSTDPGTITHP